MIERVDIRHNAVEQFALTVSGESGRGERQQFAEGVNTQMLQYTKRRVVTDQSFEITTCGSGNCRPANASRREHVVKTVDPGDTDNGGSRQEPA